MMHTVRYRKVKTGEYLILLDGAEVGLVWRTQVRQIFSDLWDQVWDAVPLSDDVPDACFVENTRREATEQLIGWLTKKESA